MCASIAGGLSSCQPGRLKESGIRLGEETLERFEKGKTREAWLLALIGEPTTVSQVADDPSVHVLRYTTSEASTGLLNVISGKSSHTTGTTYFVIRDGVVIDFWADRETERTLLGNKVEKDSGEKRKD